MVFDKKLRGKKSIDLDIEIVIIFYTGNRIEKREKFSNKRSSVANCKRVDWNNETCCGGNVLSRPQGENYSINRTEGERDFVCPLETSKIGLQFKTRDAILVCTRAPGARKVLRLIVKTERKACRSEKLFARRKEEWETILSIDENEIFI